MNLRTRMNMAVIDMGPKLEEAFSVVLIYSGVKPDDTVEPPVGVDDSLSVVSSVVEVSSLGSGYRS